MKNIKKHIFYEPFDSLPLTDPFWSELKTHNKTIKNSVYNTIVSQVLGGIEMPLTEITHSKVRLGVIRAMYYRVKHESTLKFIDIL